MSSFDYTDNFCGFNDLFNRIEILQEKDWKTMVGSAKLRPEFAKYKAEDPKTGKMAPPGGLSRLANLLYITALGEAHLDMISGEVANALARASTSTTNLPKVLLQLAPEVFEELFNDENPKSVEVAEYVNNPENRPRLVQYIIKNFTPKNREFIKDVDPEDLDDAVGDAVDDIENAADTISGDFKKEIDKIVSADPTTFIEIKIQDMDRAEDVSKMVSRYANEDGVEITNDGVQFSIDPDMPLAIAAKNLALKGLEQKIESELQGDISRVTDNIVILHLPQKVIDQAETYLRFKDLPGAEEDYEQIDDEEYEGPSMANNPGGAPSSYAQGEEGGGLTTPEDNEDWIQKAVDPDHEGYCTPMSKKTCTPRRKALARTFKKMGRERKAEEEEDDLHDYIKRTPEELEGYEHEQAREEIDDISGDRWGEKWDLDFNNLHPGLNQAITDFEDYLIDMNNPDGTDASLHDLKDIVDEIVAAKVLDDDVKAQVIGYLKQRARHAGLDEFEITGEEGIFSDVDNPPYVPEWEIDEEERITDVFYKYVDKIEQDIYNGMTFKESMISNKIDPSHWNNLLDIYTEYMEDKTEGPFETGFENEEEFSYSPMLDSYKTSTAGYLTEQAALDKRNKKTEVKPQSFKEKYKPKTHWQLQELRRYGL
mgnify:CR=1 FL=1|tara:strand:+ start:30 stop:1988 length:1959 start_codon:yes stop_codon:yes gene_type:complete